MIWKIENRFLRALAAIALLPVVAVLIALLLLMELVEAVAKASVLWVAACGVQLRRCGFYHHLRAIVGRDAK